MSNSRKGNKAAKSFNFTETVVNFPELISKNRNMKLNAKYITTVLRTDST